MLFVDAFVDGYEIDIYAITHWTSPDTYHYLRFLLYYIFNIIIFFFFWHYRNIFLCIKKGVCLLKLYIYLYRWSPYLLSMVREHVPGIPIKRLQRKTKKKKKRKNETGNREVHSYNKYMYIPKKHKTYTFQMQAVWKWVDEH